MSTPAAASAPASAPRTRPWKPSARDHAIYRAVAIEGRTQRAAGEEFGRSQSAVSRLLGRFERWRGGAGPEDSGDLDPLRQQHLDRWLARQRHDEVYTRAMRLAQRMEEQPAAIQRTRTDPEGQTIWSEETKRDQFAAAGQMLKTALRANEALEGFADKEPLPPLPGAAAPINYQRLLADLTRIRQEAEETGRVPKSRTQTTAEIWLRALAGERQEWYLAHHSSDSEALLGLVESVLSSRIGLKAAAQRAAEAGAEAQGSAAAPASAAGVQASVQAAPDSAGQESVEPGEGCVRHAESDPALSSNPQSEVCDPQSPPTHQTHTRIFVGGHPPRDPAAAADVATPVLPKPWDPYRGGGRVVMLDPATGKKYGAPQDDAADDPLGRLYRRIEDRLHREAHEARLRAAAGG